MQRNKSAHINKLYDDQNLIITDALCFFTHDSYQRYTESYQPYKIEDYDLHSLTKNGIDLRWEPNQVIRYTFKLPSDASALNNLNNIELHDTKFPVQELDLSKKNVVRTGFSIWQDASTLTFIEDDIDFHHRIIGFHSKDNVLGYADHGKVLPGTGTIGFSINKNYDVSYVTLHEMGHVAGLYHPFERPFAQSTGFKTTHTFSIMNYHDEKSILKEHHVMMSPMPVDYLAIQKLYGEPKAENKIYHLDQFLLKTNASNSYRTYAALPLIKGAHTLSAENFDIDFVLDLRNNGRTSCQYGDVYTSYEIKNVITGRGAHKIYLNHLDNVVNATASKQTSLYVDPNNCGRNTISGFHPKRDKIILSQQKKFSLREEKINCYQNNIISNEKCPATTIVFDHDQKISLLDVSKNNINIADVISTYHHYLPKKLFSDFLCSFIQGSAISFIHTLTDELLDYYDCTPTQKSIVIFMLEAFYILYSGNVIANFVGTAVGEILLRNFYFSPNLSHYWGKAATFSINLFEQVGHLDVATCSEAAVSLLGNLAGTVFSFWCKKNIYQPLKEKLNANINNNNCSK